MGLRVGHALRVLQHGGHRVGRTEAKNTTVRAGKTGSEHDREPSAQFADRLSVAVRVPTSVVAVISGVRDRDDRLAFDVSMRTNVEQH